MPVTVQPTVSTSVTSGSSRHSRSTPDRPSPSRRKENVHVFILRDKLERHASFGDCHTGRSVVASVIRSAFGFGEALIAVTRTGSSKSKLAAPVSVLASITVALIAVIQDWRKIHLRSAIWLVLPTLVGIPLGLVLLKAVPESIVKALLATVIISFSAYSLLGRTRRVEER